MTTADNLAVRRALGGSSSSTRTVADQVSPSEAAKAEALRTGAAVFYETNPIFLA
jgi:hypothetical protein